MAAHELRNLARLCGVTMEFRDNFGKRRRPSRATMVALLTAMGVPCGTPAEIRDSLDHSLSLLTGRLLPPVTVVTPDTGRCLLLHLRWPRTEIPSGMDLAGEFTSEDGEKREWLPAASHLSLKAVQPTTDGNLLQLSLPLPPDLPLGYYDLKFSVKLAGREQSVATYLAVSPGQAYIPPDLEPGGRLWGLNLPLYALRSSHNWGIGDFADLRTATAWAQELGAAFVGVNPLHAPQPGLNADPSSYSPSSRLFLNYLYINLENVPELQDSPEAQALLASPDFQADLTRLRHAPLVSYRDVRRLKGKFLHILFDAFIEHHGLPAAPRTPRGRDFARFVAEGGKTLKNFSLFQALVWHQGKKDWRRWPRDLKRPDTPAVAAFAREHPREIAFYQYVQWLAAGQRQEVWAEASRVGLPFTLYQDMALGAHPGGFETWGHPGFFASGATIGAPPDAFNLKGQNWGLPPLIPRSLEESGYRLFIDTLRANLPPGGLVRLDHVMGLFRLYWIPAGLDPLHGAYVRYPARDLLGLLTLESQRRRTLVIGEDLGTVAPSIRRNLAHCRIFSYRVFYFERKGKKDNTFTAPQAYPRQAMACVTTHDLPTLAGYWEGRDLDLRQQLNLYPSPLMAAEDKASRAQDRHLMVEALVREGLLPPDYSPPADMCPEEIRRGVLAYLGQSRAALVETRLEDFLGLTAQQNLPGTIDQHPNWRQKIFTALEDLRHNPEVIRLAATLRQARNNQTQIQPKRNFAMPPATLIYNLFPPLFGSIPRWEEHLDRIAGMGFTWIYLNPINTPGLSGSLYAVKDYFAINPLFDPGSGEDPEQTLAHFLAAAQRRNLKVMLDLVINHTAIDSPLTVQHSEWFAKDEDGRIKNPSAIDPADATHITIWGDLAELEYWPPPDPEGLQHFWDQVLSYYLRLGFAGFRCDAAYKIPGDFWARLIGEARNLVPDVQFFAETLGCRLKELAQLSSAGFDFIYNSSKWWDFQEPWCLEQYNRFRAIAPSISFPETHDTDRLAKESGGSIEVARQRYLFAAFFSTGLLMPAGYEYGFKKRLNVVKTRPQDWETPNYDLSTYISQVNRMKMNCPVLLEEGPMVRFKATETGKAPVVFLVKSRENRKGRVLAVINTTGQEQQVELPDVTEMLGEPASGWEDLTPDMIPLRLSPSLNFSLAPFRLRLFHNPKGEPLAVELPESKAD